ncbi:hypothetical protein RB195_023750 [Necator americanus]|uniref:Uncharacterized protein n=1 Tax=Necator americanus TaxID=51031 RepID=A0ABR1EKE7_NECAM
MVKTLSGLHIAKTVFGPAIYGKEVVDAKNKKDNLCYGPTTVHENSEQEILRKMFELEGLGISAQDCQKDDMIHKYLDEYSKKISFEQGRIIAPFPSKENIS